MRSTRAGAAQFGLLIAVALVPACTNSPTSPGIEPEIANVPDNFEYQVSSIKNYSGTASYTWQHSGTTANINLATTGSAGGATLIVLDADGTAVFSRSLAENGTFVTSLGSAGTWTIRVVYESFTGTVNFRAQRTT